MSEDSSLRPILLVEDNPGDARLIREMLRDAQAVAWRLDHVDRLADGLRRLAEEHADVVLLDLSLPDAHGFDTVGKVLDLAPTVPIIVLTGLDDEALAVRAVQAGAQDYLVKNDVTGGLLSRAIRYAIERKRAEAERAQLLDRERAARAQAENERARFRTILDAAPGGVIYIEAATGRLTANAEASRIFDRRLSPVEGIQQYAGALFRPDGQPMPINELPSRRALRGEVVHGEEMLIVQNDGSRLPVVSAASPVRDAAGQITGAVATSWVDAGHPRTYRAARDQRGVTDLHAGYVGDRVPPPGRPAEGDAERTGARLPRGGGLVRVRTCRGHRRQLPAASDRSGRRRPRRYTSSPCRLWDAEHRGLLRPASPEGAADHESRATC